MANESKGLEQAVLNALRTVKDPDLNKDIVTLNFIKDLKIDDGNVSFAIELTTPACPVKKEMEQWARDAVMGVSGVREVQIRMTSSVSRGTAAAGKQGIPGVKNIVAVGSGKGGVGKSTVTVNLAVALAQAGASVGLLDADIYGPNIPLMMGIEGRPHAIDDRIQTLSNYGVRVMSMGFLTSDDTPLIWRGPMLHSVIQQFLHQVDWGELDYLLIDLPPGTGDVQLSLTQTVPLMGAVIVSTPQDVALQDARKAIMMFRQVRVEILGIVENMSYFQCPKCNERTPIFSHGGGAATAAKYDVPFLGEVPLDVALREGGRCRQAHCGWGSQIARSPGFRSDRGKNRGTGQHCKPEQLEYDDHRIVEILIIHPGGLGDVVLSLPAVASLRNAFPAARVTVAGNVDHLVPVLSGYAERVLSLSALPLHHLYGPGSVPESVVRFWRSYDRIVSWTGGGDREFTRKFKEIHPNVIIASWKPAPGEAKHVSQLFVDSLAY